MPDLDLERRTLLWRAKLRAPAGRHWAVREFDADPKAVAGGVAARRGDVGWMLAEEDPGRALGRGLLWALRAGVGELHLIVPAVGDHAVRAARRAQRFHTRVQVWGVEGAELVAVAAEPLSPEPPLDAGAQPFVEMIAAAGAEPVVEWGALYGDVWGLEVARLQTDPDGAWLEIGVGEQDRLLHRMMSGDEPPQKALAGVVDEARRVRLGGELSHPLNQLARERWLRAWLVREPLQVGAQDLSPLTPPIGRERRDPRAPLPAPALGRDQRGEGLLVVCSVGFDSELVPMAAELHAAVAARAERGPRLVLSLAERHDHPLLRLLAADVVVPVEVAPVPDDWPQRCRAVAHE